MCPEHPLPKVPSFPSWPTFEDDEVEAAIRVLTSGKVNYWTGEEGKLFEKEFADFTHTRHAVALANGTLALEAALFGLGLGPGDEVIIPCRTFMASASCVVMRGGRPIMADVDPDSQNLTVETIRKACTPKTRGIIAVHLAGWPCDMDPIMEFAKERGLFVIEDCAQAMGATYKGRPVGSLGHAAAFSFCQDKIMTTAGEGGMLTTSDERVWNHAWSLKDHGKSFDAVFRREHPAGFRWLCESFGTNWRLTEIQSAIGRVTLRKAPDWIEQRRRHALHLFQAFSELPALRVPLPPQEVKHAFYKFYAFVQPDRLKADWNRDRILETLNQRGIPCFMGSCSEIYLEKAFADRGWQPPERLPVARLLGETSLMFLVHHTLQPQHLETVCEAMRAIMAQASR